MSAISSLSNPVMAKRPSTVAAPIIASPMVCVQIDNSLSWMIGRPPSASRSKGLTPRLQRAVYSTGGRPVAFVMRLMRRVVIEPTREAQALR
jgi:hypothetical protein